MGVSLVSNVPLPANPVQTQSVLATESKGLSKSQPKPAVEEPTAIPIPEKNAKRKPAKQPTETQRQPKPEPQQEASNVVPFGEGGPAAGPYALFSVGAAKGGFGFTGGGGDFGSRFAWYVRVVNQKVSENWLKYEVDPRIQNANRVYVTFDIDRERASFTHTGRAVERSALAGHLGGKGATADRNLWAAPAGLSGKQGQRGILVRLQEMNYQFIELADGTKLCIAAS